jgi:SAM-dependent MidA family methyltransferase
MTPVAEKLRDEIARAGPLPFRRFMEAALYDPEGGYYRRDRFGRAGDFFTAEQVQPVFGRAVARYLRKLAGPGAFQVVELGAGRASMAEAFSGFRYLPLELGGPELPDTVEGVVFSNEFFDALPVDRVFFRHGVPVEARVDWDGGRFVWAAGGPVDEGTEEYLRRYFPDWKTRRSAEVHFAALDWIGRIAARLRRGYHVAIDYGYTTRESARFPDGALMSYRRHQASEDVLAEPGERDITAHVPWDALADAGARYGWELVSLRTLAHLLLEAGEDDQFAGVLGDPAPLALRLQLKTLLFGMGETFQVLVQRAAGPALPAAWLP